MDKYKAEIELLNNGTFSAKPLLFSFVFFKIWKQEFVLQW